jgi:hypothetical protein
MTSKSIAPPNTGISREAVALSGISDALIWRHVLKPSKEYRSDLTGPGKRIIIYLEFLTKLGLVLTTGNLGMDSQEDFWPAYQAILSLVDTRQDDCRPI